MIFGQGDRFIHQNVHPNGELMAIDQKHETDSVVGPGAYYDARRESKRSGWKKDVASRIQPMAGHASPQRHNHQNGSILLPTGLLVAAPSSDIDASPGPGHYNVNKSTLKISSKTSTPVRQQFLSRPGSAQGSPNKTGTSSPGGGLSQTYNGSMGASPRMAHTLTALNNGLLVMGDGRSQESASPGPGYYLSPNAGSSLLKKSFNALVSPHSPRRMPTNVNSRPSTMNSPAGMFSPSPKKSH